MHFCRSVHPPQRSLYTKPCRCDQSKHSVDWLQPRKCGHYPTTDLAHFDVAFAFYVLDNAVNQV